MTVYQSVPDAVGNTPLIRLRKASELTGCDIYGKAEFMNPGQSVKDRAALSMIRDAEARGTLRPGGTIVEGTAGNTGIGLAVIGGALGYRSVIVIPETQTQEKKDMLRLLAAKLNETEPNGAIWANQFDNVANRQAHIDTTGPEIWAQTDGQIDGFICAVGSGGTLAGIAQVLQPKGVTVGLADVEGAAIYNWFAHGELKAEGSSVAEGIGQGRITKNIEGLKVDHAYQIPDSEGMPIVFDLLREEGLCMGLSTGINVAGAIRLARELGPGKTIVTILCDYGTRYQSKLFNPAFLKEKGLPCPDWLEHGRTDIPSVLEA